MNIKDIPVDDEIDYTSQVNEVLDGELIYQFQFNGTEWCKLVHVGTTLKHADVLINSFDYKKFKCHIISCLYNNKELSELGPTCTFPLFKLNLCKGSNFHSCINYSFHTFKHVQEEKNIVSYAKNSKDVDFNLKGYYSVTYHNNGQIKYKKTYKITTTHEDVIETLIESLVLIFNENIV